MTCFTEEIKCQKRDEPTCRIIDGTLLFPQYFPGHQTRWKILLSSIQNLPIKLKTPLHYPKGKKKPTREIQWVKNRYRCKNSSLRCSMMTLVDAFKAAWHNSYMPACITQLENMLSLETKSKSLKGSP